MDIGKKGTVIFPEHPQNILQSIIWVIAVAIAYFIIAHLSLLIVFKPEGIAAIWPPSGIFLSAVLLSHRNLRPYLIGTLFITDLIAELISGNSLPISIIYSFSLSMDAAFSAWILNRFLGQTISFNKVKEVAAFIFFSVLLSNALSSIVASIAPKIFLGLSFWIKI